jgi:tRNA A-37 threonylcarbamoyl transferase component Bud32/tetratricopeptide (TPR) repeat protein
MGSEDSRIDEACDRFEEEWRTDRSPRLEAFLVPVPSSERPGLLRQLLRVEVELRQERGERPATEEYIERFPDYPEAVRLAFADNLPQPPYGLADSRLGAAPLATIGTGPDGRETVDDPEVTTGRSIAYLGDYELIEEIGAGGMGVVYKARQVSLDRLVAVKVIRAGRLATRGERQRFRNEAETVGSLDHPHIVPILEVGEYHGIDYFSMRLVPGESLAGCLLAYPADRRAAAQLIATVARAVHHAHQRGVLHRDLKPANILIDPEGRPHVTDFGLARRSGTTSLTQSDAILGTPSYMAPEQAAGDRRAVTTATDVYGLGALLYTVLAGQPPFRAGSPGETLDHVRHRPPRPPLGPDGRMDRDLATVCLRCLEKDPNRRYGSAAALADDLDRWLAGDPTMARPVGRAERLWLWCRREPLAAALSTALATALLAGLTGILWKWREADYQKRLLLGAQAEILRQRNDALAARDEAVKSTAKSEAIRRMLFDTMFVNAIPALKARERKVSFEELLDWMAAKVDTNLAGQPEVQAQMDYTLGQAYIAMGAPIKAEALLRRSSETLRQCLGAEHPDTLEKTVALAVALLHLGRAAEAERLLVPAREAIRLRGVENPSARLATGLLVWALQDQGKTTEAGPLMLEALEHDVRSYGEDHRLTLEARIRVGNLLVHQGRAAEAEPVLRATRNSLIRSVGAENPTTLATTNILAWSLLTQNKAAEAEPLLVDNLSALRRVLGDEHADTMMAVNHLAWALHAQGKVAEAEPMLRRNLEDRRRVLGDRHPDTLVALDHLASMLFHYGRAAEAEPLLLTSLALRQQLGSPPSQLAATEILLGRCLTALARYGEAEPILLGAHERLLADGVGSPDSVREAAEQIAALYESWKKPAKVMEWRDKSAHTRTPSELDRR